MISYGFWASNHVQRILAEWWWSVSCSATLLRGFLPDARPRGIILLPRLHCSAYRLVQSRIKTHVPRILWRLTPAVVTAPPASFHTSFRVSSTSTVLSILRHFNTLTSTSAATKTTKLWGLLGNIYWPTVLLKLTSRKPQQTHPLPGDMSMPCYGVRDYPVCTSPDVGTTLRLRKGTH